MFQDEPAVGGRPPRRDSAPTGPAVGDGVMESGRHRCGSFCGFATQSTGGTGDDPPSVSIRLDRPVRSFHKIKISIFTRITAKARFFDPRQGRRLGTPCGSLATPDG